jgi:hypothetical protein
MGARTSTIANRHAREFMVISIVAVRPLTLAGESGSFAPHNIDANAGDGRRMVRFFGDPM